MNGWTYLTVLTHLKQDIKNIKFRTVIIYMVETIALMANGDPQFKVVTPTRVGETERGKYIIYEDKNEIDERNK